MATDDLPAHDPVPPADPGEIVQQGWDTGDFETAARRLDEWEARQPASIETLSTLRYHRPRLDQYDRAIEAARKLVELRPDGWQKISDLLELGRLYASDRQPERAWEALRLVLAWPDLRDWYDAGLARSAVELALRIAGSPLAPEPLAREAFRTAVSMLDEGCSTSLLMLRLARGRARSLGDDERFARFNREYRREAERIEAALRGDPPA